MNDQTAKKPDYCIRTHATNKQFLNVFGLVAIERIRIEIANYDPRTKRHTQFVQAYIAIADTRMIVHQVLHAQVVQDWKHEFYGGSTTESGIESRVTTIKYDRGQNDSYARFPFQISIAIGHGKKTATGGIAPDGKPHTQAFIRLSEQDMLKLCLEIEAYLTCHQKQLEAVRYRVQLDRWQAYQEATNA